MCFLTIPTRFGKHECLFIHGILFFFILFVIHIFELKNVTILVGKKDKLKEKKCMGLEIKPINILASVWL